MYVYILYSIHWYSCEHKTIALQTYIFVHILNRYTHAHKCVCLPQSLTRQINLNKKRSGNPRSTSNQSSKPCTVLPYPSRKVCTQSLARQIYSYVYTSNLFICLLKYRTRPMKIYEIMKIC